MKTKSKINFHSTCQLRFSDVIAPGTGSPEVTNIVQIKKDETYTDLDKNEKVILGSDMKVTFNGPEMAGFYIKSCVASDNDETKTLALGEYHLQAVLWSE